jgi:alginate O-acetyltransferase complex protein AlgI
VLFSDKTFFVFFAVYLTLHFVVPARARIYLIIVGSTVFYAWWRVDYIWLPYALTLIAWSGTLWLESVKDPVARTRRLIVTIMALFTPLVVVKYVYFLLNDAIKPMLDPRALADISFLKFALPLGISFVTFTLTAYVVDVYRRLFPVERNLVRMLGYVLFFPHLIAGPILRPNELLPQLGQLRRAIDARFTLGVALFAIGLVKKVVFADTIAAVVDQVYRQGTAVSGWEYLLAIHGFSMQIYCDFSGYTDMALGIALILGVRLPGNFSRPYLATSIADFWRRWHITLSHWLRDYIYIPLGGNRGGAGKTTRNLMITMAIGGLWHGANWTFLIWGILHGVGVAVSQLLHRHSPTWIRPPNWMTTAVTFHVVVVLWVFFRSPDLTSAIVILKGCLGGATFENAPGFIAGHIFEVVLILAFFLIHPWDDGRRIRILAKKSQPIVAGAVILMGALLVFAIGTESSSEFIYFEF